MSVQAIKKDASRPLPYGSSFDHLRDELHKLDLLISRQVLRLRAGINEQHSNSGMYISHTEVDRLLQEGGDMGPDTPEILAIRRQFELLDQEISARLAASQEGKIFLALPCLGQMFGLSATEMQSLVICLAPELDRKYDTLYAYLQDDITRKKPSVDLVLQLLGDSREERWQLRQLLASNAKLLRSGILQSVPDPHSPSGSSDLAMLLKVDRRIVDLIMGHNAVDSRLSRCARLLSPTVTMDEVAAAPEIKTRLLSLVSRHIKRDMIKEKMMIALNGPAGSGKTMLAQAICRELQCSMLVVDMDLLPADDGEWENTMGLALREGLLTRSILFFDNIDVLAERADKGRTLLKKMARAIAEYGWLVFLAGEKAGLEAGCFGELQFLSIAVPAPQVPIREQVWQEMLATEPADISRKWSAKLARRFALTPGQIAGAMRTARTLKAGGDRNRKLSLSELYAACRSQSHHKLAELSVKTQAQYSWSDLVLPEEKTALLQEICAQVKHQYRVFNEWGFAQKVSYGRGLSVLFSGPPGTGKTMAAQVMASELQLDLYKIDLSSIVSKYIGETEKNLSRIFAEAELSNAILFFDEADALFGKRTEVKDAHDRYANIETSYLLQKMEEYEGMVILATNLRSNMDDAFTRRIRFIVEFPFPDAALRARIWQSHFPREAPVKASIDYDFLARRFQVAGGSIRNIVLNTAFLAAESNEEISMEHIMHGVKREFEKIGKLWNEETINRSDPTRT
ncbi:MAG: ATP-binding protein [Proteobacteria bacterium]|nr:ATP-binding protein [Pseudomonadota bacterium]MBU0965300.1 ATP-binding protein [Pseudomonadota bacterium]